MLFVNTFYDTKTKINANLNKNLYTPATLNHQKFDAIFLSITSRCGSCWCIYRKMWAISKRTGLESYKLISNSHTLKIFAVLKSALSYTGNTLWNNYFSKRCTAAERLFSNAGNAVGYTDGSKICAPFKHSSFDICDTAWNNYALKALTAGKSPCSYMRNAVRYSDLTKPVAVGESALINSLHTIWEVYP